jgi:hypothetical protein
MDSGEARMSVTFEHHPHPRIAERKTARPAKTRDEHVGLNGKIALALLGADRVSLPPSNRSRIGGARLRGRHHRRLSVARVSGEGPTREQVPP